MVLPAMRSIVRRRRLRASSPRGFRDAVRLDPPATSAECSLRLATYRRSVKARGQSHDLAVEPIEAVMATSLAGVALFRSAADPARTRAPRRPFDERLDPGRQCELAAILTVMDDEGARQRGR